MAVGGDSMLDHLRSEIDDCDTILTDALLRRLMTATSVAAYKKENRLSLYQPDRETAILSKIGLELQDYPFAEQIQGIYKSIFRISRCIQMQHVCPYNIVLIGFMGSGKTTVGRYLAEKSGYNYYDVDSIIERETGQPIPDIFKRYGEDYFRSLERQTIESVSNKEHAVISCGGGSILDQNNVACLKQTGKLVWLMAEPETLYERIKNEGSRPLIANKTFKDISDMLKKRHPLYSNAADYRIAIDSKTVSEIADTIINMIMWQDNARWESLER